MPVLPQRWFQTSVQSSLTGYVSGKQKNTSPSQALRIIKCRCPLQGVRYCGHTCPQIVDSKPRPHLSRHEVKLTPASTCDCHRPESQQCSKHQGTNHCCKGNPMNCVRWLASSLCPYGQLPKRKNCATKTRRLVKVYLWV